MPIVRGLAKINIELDQLLGFVAAASGIGGDTGRDPNQAHVRAARDSRKLRAVIGERSGGNSRPAFGRGSD